MNFIGKLGSHAAYAVHRVSNSVRYRVNRFKKKKRRQKLDLAAAEIANLIQAKEYAEAVNRYKRLIADETMADEIYEVAGQWSQDGSLADAFHRACIDSLKSDELRGMINSVAGGAKLYQPSKFWLYYATYHALQIDMWGVDNFKRTVNNGYFNWTNDGVINEQRHNIEQDLGLSVDAVQRMHPTWERKDKPENFKAKQWFKYGQFLCLLFEYARKHDSHDLLKAVSESRLGNPTGVTYDGHYITQDLANSVADVNLMLDVTGLDAKKPLRIMELGAGHGRIMYTFLKAFPQVQIVVVDIPPALYVSQWYLTNAFPNLKCFKFREIANYEEVKQDFESASLAFLTPEQIELVPGKSIDLFVNISSLHEMTPEQIKNWFQQIDRVCRGWFYTKQFREYPNLIDNLVIREADYPVLTGWQEKMKRINPVFMAFFEAVYKV